MYKQTLCHKVADLLAENFSFKTILNSSVYSSSVYFPAKLQILSFCLYSAESTPDFGIQKCFVQVIFIPMVRLAN